MTDTPTDFRPVVRDGACEWFCEGCGILVIAFGRDGMPPHGLCSVCEWLCEHVPDPEAMEAYRRELGHLDPTPRPRKGYRA